MCFIQCTNIICNSPIYKLVSLKTVLELHEKVNSVQCLYNRILFSFSPQVLSGVSLYVDELCVQHPINCADDTNVGVQTIHMFCHKRFSISPTFHICPTKLWFFFFFCWQQHPSYFFLGCWTLYHWHTIWYLLNMKGTAIAFVSNQMHRTHLLGEKWSECPTDMVLSS